MANAIEPKNLLDDYLLNDGPKQDCLVHVCKYLNVNDLINLSDFSQNTELFIEFINDRVNFATKTFDFTKIEKREKVFQYFGPSMQKVKGSFTIVEFIEFLTYVIKYCVPGKMTDFTIHNNGHNAKFPKVLIDDCLMIQVRPYIHRLEKFTLLNRYIDHSNNCEIRRFFEFFRQNLPSLGSLTLKNFHVNENFLQFLPDGPSNITEIYFNDLVIFKDLGEFEQLLKRLKNLQVFVYMNCDVNFIHIEAIADCLYKYFPNLKGFGCSIQQVLLDTNSEIGDRFKFLEKFKHLTEYYVSGPINVRASCDIQNAIKFVPNVKLLSLYQIHTIPQMPVVIRRIAKTIKTIIENRSNSICPTTNDCIHVIVNNGQYREFRAIKNIDNFISLEDMSMSDDFLSDYYEFPSIRTPVGHGFPMMYGLEDFF